MTYYDWNRLAKYVRNSQLGNKAQLCKNLIYAYCQFDVLPRSYYADEVIKFLETPNEWILGKLTNNHQFELKEQQRNVWNKEIEILKQELKDLTSGRIIFEYSIPRMGKRADIILILNGLVFVIEFKLNENQYKNTDINQCFDYVLDLKYFHEESYTIKIIPILVATNAVDFNNPFEPPYADGVFKPLKCNRKNLNKTIQRLSYEFGGNYLDPIKWENSVYKPTPTIIEATQALYQGHSVREISRSDSGAENLTKTADAINKIIEKSKRNKTKSICFITGVPGAGKTLAGLNLANERHKFSEEEHAVFLSGNGPLVEVLQEALARNKVENSLNKIKKIDALRESKAFIQNIYHFREEGLENTKPPIEKVVVFDEAQRAWNQKQTSSFMQRKKGIDNFIQSEPEFLISVMDRGEDWCVIVCLIGGGQEINTGEAGLLEWFSAIKKQFNHWQVYVSNEISDTEYTRELDLKNLFDGISYEFVSDLHLKTSIRSFRSEHVAKFVKATLDCHKYFDKALAIDENDKDALYNKGLALIYLGESQEAIEYFDKALAIRKDMQDENQTDFTLVVENATSEPNIIKFELKGESFDQICPSHQCEIVKYTYTHFSSPTPSNMNIAYHIEFRYQDDITNANIGPKKKEFLEQFDSSM